MGLALPWKLVSVCAATRRGTFVYDREKDRWGAKEACMGSTYALNAERSSRYGGGAGAGVDTDVNAKEVALVVQIFNSIENVRTVTTEQTLDGYTTDTFQIGVPPVCPLP